MIRRNHAKSSSLFLMELILAILFFSIASAVCVQFFVKSHLLNQSAQELNHAVNECGSVAEVIGTSDSLSDALSALKEIYPESGADLAVVSIYYDGDFAVCAESEAVYRLDCELYVDESDLLTGELSVVKADADGAIYTLTVKHYLS